MSSIFHLPLYFSCVHYVSLISLFSDSTVSPCPILLSSLMFLSSLTCILFCLVWTLASAKPAAADHARYTLVGPDILLSDWMELTWPNTGVSASQPPCLGISGRPNVVRFYWAVGLMAKILNFGSHLSQVKGTVKKKTQSLRMRSLKMRRHYRVNLVIAPFDRIMAYVIYLCKPHGPQICSCKPTDDFISLMSPT